MGATIGCATTKSMPVHPTRDIEEAKAASSIRFDSEQIRFRDPIMTVSGGNLWKREVGAYTAEQLNTALNTTPGGTPVSTEVTFEMHPASTLQLGSWKEMTIQLTTFFPNGRVVESDKISAYIDNNFEFAVQQCFVFGGPVLEIASFVGAIYVLTQPVLFNAFTCGCILAVGLSGVAMHLAQGVSQILVAANEERRWSDLYLDALEGHAQDIRDALKSGAPPKKLPSISNPYSENPAPSPPPPSPPSKTAPNSAPPSMIQDPADEPPPAPASPAPAPVESAPKDGAPVQENQPSEETSEDSSSPPPADKTDRPADAVPENGEKPQVSLPQAH